MSELAASDCSNALRTCFRQFFRAITVSVTLLVVNVARADYQYVAGFDLTPTTKASVNLPVNAQTVSIGQHSLFEMSLSNHTGSTGNIIEVGVTTDFALNGDLHPHWFVYSWINGVGQGYDSHSHFVSIAGAFWSTPLTALEGTWQNVAFQLTGGNWWLLLNGNSMGYFPGSEWSGSFTISNATEVFGEAYDNGATFPSVNGTVTGYSSAGGGHLGSFRADNPYHISNASATGFTASGPMTPLVGDVNKDGIVNGQDIGLVVSNWLSTGANPADVNADRIVNGQDIALIASNWLATGATQVFVPVAEPASVMLGLMGSLSLLTSAMRRNRRSSMGTGGVHVM